jgi:DNA replication protein DnaC
MEPSIPLIHFQDLIPSTSAFEFIHRIFQGPPGIFATTGQSGTGKLILLLAIVQEFVRSDLSVTLITEEQNFLFELPIGWSIRLVEPT